jgi:hypothetical protein
MELNKPLNGRRVVSANTGTVEIKLATSEAERFSPPFYIKALIVFRQFYVAFCFYGKFSYSIAREPCPMFV